MTFADYLRRLINGTHTDGETFATGGRVGDSDHAPSPDRTPATVRDFPDDHWRRSNRRQPAADIATAAGSRIPGVGRPYPIPDLNQPGGPAMTQPNRPATLADALTEPPTEIITAPAESGVHALPRPAGATGDCPTCGGTGRVTRTVNDLLRETVSQLTDPDGMVREFYRRLLAADPDRANADKLGPLFPPDLLGSATNPQRDRLVEALVGLSELYDPDRPGSLDRLDTILRTFGRAHSAFRRPDGTVRPASPEEYAAVKTALFGTLTDVLGPDRLTPDHAAAWSEAYNYAVDVMRDEQRLARRGQTAPFPREPRTAR